MSFRNPPFELIPRHDDAAQPVFKLYHYNPTIAGAVIFVLFFLGTTCLHFYQLWRARTWFMVPLVLGGICKSPHGTNPGRSDCNAKRSQSRHPFTGTIMLLMQRMPPLQSQTKLHRHPRDVSVWKGEAPRKPTSLTFLAQWNS
jgi:hypothetical protein